MNEYIILKRFGLLRWKSAHTILDATLHGEVFKAWSVSQKIEMMVIHEGMKPHIDAGDVVTSSQLSIVYLA